MKMKIGFSEMFFKDSFLPFDQRGCMHIYTYVVFHLTSVTMSIQEILGPLLIKQTEETL